MSCNVLIGWWVRAAIGPALGLGSSSASLLRVTLLCLCNSHLSYGTVHIIPLMQLSFSFHSLHYLIPHNISTHRQALDARRLTFTRTGDDGGLIATAARI